MKYSASTVSRNISVTYIYECVYYAVIQNEFLFMCQPQKFKSHSTTANESHLVLPIAWGFILEIH